MPTLHGSRQVDPALLQLFVHLSMASHVAEERLSLTSLKSKVAIAVEVRRQLQPVVVLEVAVQDLDHCLKGLGFLRSLQVKVPEESPGCPSHTSDDVQQGLTGSLHEGHLAVVDVNSLPPPLVVSGLPGEEWDETISG